MQWLADRWHQIVDAFSHHVHVGPKVSLAFGDVLLAAAIAVVAIVGIRLILSIAREQNRPAAGSRLLAQRLDADALYAQSTRAAGRGDYRAAATLLFRASVTALDLRGVVHDDPSQTVNETRAAVRAHAPASISTFDVIARTFTAALYADAPVSMEQWGAARNAFLQLTIQVRANAA